MWVPGLTNQSQTESELTNDMLKLPQKHGNETTKKTTKVTEMVAGKQFLGKTPTR